MAAEKGDKDKDQNNRSLRGVRPIRRERDSGIRSEEQRDQTIGDRIMVPRTGTKGLVSRWDKMAI